MSLPPTLLLAALTDTGLIEAARLHALSFPPHETWNTLALASLLAQPHVGGAVVPDGGMALWRCLPESDAELLTLAVAPAARRHGLGRRLTEAALEAARAALCVQLVLEVADDNVPARTLYQHLGFSLLGHRRGYYRRPGEAPVDALLLARRLGSDEPGGFG